MATISPALKMFLNLTMVQSLTSKRFDAKLHGHGLSLNEFLILVHLAEAPDEKLRRTDLAEKTGLSASGITRMLSPLEKSGLVKREANNRDARVSYVKLTTAGKRTFNDALLSAEATSEQLLTPVKSKKLDELMKLLTELGGAVV